MHKEGGDCLPGPPFCLLSVDPDVYGDHQPVAAADPAAPANIRSVTIKWLHEPKTDATQLTCR